MAEKLDQLSKILLATGTINYLATSMFCVNKDMKYLVHRHPETEKVHGGGIKEKDEVLDEVIGKLTEVMELLGNTLSNCDAVCPLDQYVTTPAFQVVVHGNDNPEGDFDNL